MDTEQVHIQIAELRGEIKAFRELFGQHIAQEGTRDAALAETTKDLKNSMDEIDTKVNDLLIREAGRTGELRGIKQTVITIATVVASIVSGLIGVIGIAYGYVG